jgi:hypothetical protein
MPDENKPAETVLDAVNAALGESTASEPEETTDETPEADVSTETPDDAGSDTGDEPSADGDAEGEAEETDAEAEARGAERDPLTGKFVKKGEEKPAEPEKKAEPKPKDPINDPIPKDLKKETSERIRTLIDTAKTVTAERDKVQNDFNYLIKGVEATGTTPQQYGEALSWLALFNSDDPAQQEKALELVETVAERLATLLGKDRTVGDPLAAHADLKDAVTKGQLTAQYAKELARVRNGQQFRQELTTQASTAEQHRQQAAQEEQQGRQSLHDLEQTLMKSDPQYEQKKALLVPVLKPIMQQIPWGQRAEKFMEAYRNIKIGGLPAARKPVPANQPLRAGKNPAGGQTKAPSSMLEAVSGALSGMKK